MALGTKKITPKRPRTLEELACLADSWADMCDRHQWSGDNAKFVEATGQKLRDKAASLRALLLLKVKHEI